MQKDLDLRCNLISVDFKVAQNSYGDMFKVGETVGHEDNDQTAVIQSFELDEESNEVKAWTDKGWSHLDFITKHPQDTTENLSLDDLLNKHAKQHMIEWDLERFKISHRRLYATFRAVFNEGTTDNAKDFEIEALKRQIAELRHEKNNSQK